MDFDLSSVIENPVALMQLRKLGFKFEPSPQQLIIDHLVPKTRGDIMKGLPMAELYLCELDPWDLPAKSIIKNLADHAWYFICPRDLKYEHGKLTKRNTKSGYWKATCAIKPITDERTKKTIGVMNTLTFYKTAKPKDVRTGWMIYEFDLITDSNLHKKGQYVLCRLEYKSEDKKTRKGEQSHHIASSVSHSEVEPSQRMASYFENNNPSQMAVESPCDESELSHHVVSRIGNQNSSELMNTSARQLRELSHHMASHFTNQNSNKLVSSLAYDGIGSSHSTVFNSENPYWNQPTVDSAYNGSESPYMAFNSENPNWNQPTADSAYEGIESPYMSFDSENQNPNNQYMTFDSEFQNPNNEYIQNPNNQYMVFDSEYQNPNNHYMTFDSEFQNPYTQYMAFDSEYQNPNNHYMAFDSENQNPNNQYMAFDSENQNPNNQYMAFDSEFQNPNNQYIQNPNTQYMAFDSEYQNPNNHYMAFDSEFQNPNNQYIQNPNNQYKAFDSEFQNPNNQYMVFDSEFQNPNNQYIQNPNNQYMAFNSEFQNPNNHYMAYDSENQNPSFTNQCPSMVTPCSFTNQSTYDKRAPSSLMAFYFKNKNLYEEIDISGFGEGERSYLTATPPDFGNQNPGKKTDMSTLEENYSKSSFSDNDLADVDLPELSPELLAEIEGFFSEHGDSPNTALDQLPVCMEESHSNTGFVTSAST